MQRTIRKAEDAIVAIRTDRDRGDWSAILVTLWSHRLGSQGLVFGAPDEGGVKTLMSRNNSWPIMVANRTIGDVDERRKACHVMRWLHGLQMRRHLLEGSLGVVDVLMVLNERDPRHKASAIGATAHDQLTIVAAAIERHAPGRSWAATSMSNRSWQAIGRVEDPHSYGIVTATRQEKRLVWQEMDRRDGPMMRTLGDMMCPALVEIPHNKRSVGRAGH
mmetsp:Transcript_31461/g.90898  ORF Transcript_31461/g.90898 Transcript_31461/m.90898 type:complete len:219 (+) Transcript_31461:1505-2161(+)